MKNIKSLPTVEPLPIASDAKIQLLGGLEVPCVTRIQESQRVSEPLVPQADSKTVFHGQEGNGLLVRRTLTPGEEFTEISLHIEACKSMKQISVSQTIAFDLAPTSYIIAPGVVYDGNRFLVSHQTYCPHIPGEGVTSDGPVLVTDLPRLTADSGYQVDLAANALTTPMLGICDQEKGGGVLVELPIYGDWGVSGVSVIALPGEPIKVTLSLPVQRTRRYRFCDWVQANETGMDLAAGQIMEAKMRVVPVPAATIPEFVGVLARRSFEQRSQKVLASRVNLGQKLRDAADMVEAKFDEYNWDERRSFYRTISKTNQSPLFLLQTGWSGGGTTMLALLLSPNPQRRARAQRMISFLCEACAPSGYFYGGFDGQRWLSFGLKRPGCQAFAFVRRPLECGRDLLKAFDVLEKRGEFLEDSWLETAQRFLNALVKTEVNFGHLGYTVSPETGDVIWGPSTASAFAIEALVRGYQRFGQSAYLETAKRLAAFCYKTYLGKGYTLGGVGDALMAVDSESSYALLAGLVHLHKATEDAQHLAWAVEAADLFQTWVLLYDAKLPEGSPLQRIGVEPRGAVFANIQNQHGAPGIYIFSGIELAMLAEQTGNHRYLHLLREIVGCLPQMVVKHGQEAVWGKLPIGAVSERLMTMDGIKPAGHTEQVDTFGCVIMISANELQGELLDILNLGQISKPE